MKSRIHNGALLLVLIGIVALLLLLFSRLSTLQSASSGGADQAAYPQPAVGATLDPSVLTLTAFPTSPPVPTSLLTPNPLDGTPNTPTPDPSIMRTITPEAPPATLPLGKIVDLTNGTPVPPEQMVIFTVERANGTYDDYHVPPWLLQHVTDDYLKQLMEIQPGDRLLAGTLHGNGGDLPPTSFIPLPTSLLTPNPLEGTPNTPTPDFYAVGTVKPETPPATLPVGKTIDLTNGTPVPPEQLVIFSVKRASGFYDEYRVPPWLLQHVTHDYMNKLLEVQPGDEILGWLPGKGSNQPPVSSPVSTPTPVS